MTITAGWYIVVRYYATETGEIAPDDHIGPFSSAAEANAARGTNIPQAMASVEHFDSAPSPMMTPEEFIDYLGKRV